MILTRVRDSEAFARQIDVDSKVVKNQMGQNATLQSSDLLFVDRIAAFHICGKVQGSGSYWVERGLTLIQAPASGGVLSQRSTTGALRITRKYVKAQVIELQQDLDESL